MGNTLFGPWKTKSTLQILEELEKGIQETDKNKGIVQRRVRNTKSLLKYSGAVYLFFCIGVYIRCQLKNELEVACLVLLAILPPVFYGMRWITFWYFDGQLKKNKLRYNALKMEKKTLLEEVKEKEPYNVAKPILDKFSSKKVSQMN